MAGALDFLTGGSSSSGGGLLGAAQLGVGIAGLLGASGGKLHGWQERAMKSSIQSNQKIGQALQQGESNPMFANLTNQEEQGLRAYGQQGLRELVLQNNRAQARGLGPLLNPERRDESLAQASARLWEQSREEARQNVRQYLLSAAGVNNQVFGGGYGAAQPYGQTGFQPQYQAADVALTGIRQLLNGQQSQASGMAPSVNLNFSTGQGFGPGGYGWGGQPIGRG